MYLIVLTWVVREDVPCKDTTFCIFFKLSGVKQWLKNILRSNRYQKMFIVCPCVHIFAINPHLNFKSRKFIIVDLKGFVLGWRPFCGVYGFNALGGEGANSGTWGWGAGIDPPGLDQDWDRDRIGKKFRLCRSLVGKWVTSSRTWWGE